MEFVKIQNKIPIGFIQNGEFNIDEIDPTFIVFKTVAFIVNPETINGLNAENMHDEKLNIQWNFNIYYFDREYTLNTISSYIIKNPEIELIDNSLKWTLKITGEKKFDYNIVKPGSIDKLKKYEKCLNDFLFEHVRIISNERLREIR